MEGTHKDNQEQVKDHTKFKLYFWEYYPVSGRLGAMATDVGSMFQCPTSLSLKNCFLIPNLTLPWCSSVPFPWVLSLLLERSTPVVLFLLWKLLVAMRPPFSILCSGLSKPSEHSCFLYSVPSRPFTIFPALLGMLAKSFISFLYSGTPTCTQNSKWGSDFQSQTREEHTFLLQHDNAMPLPVWRPWSILPVFVWLSYHTHLFAARKNRLPRLHFACNNVITAAVKPVYHFHWCRFLQTLQAVPFSWLTKKHS